MVLGDCIVECNYHRRSRVVRIGLIPRRACIKILASWNNVGNIPDINFNLWKYAKNTEQFN